MRRLSAQPWCWPLCSAAARSATRRRPRRRSACKRRTSRRPRSSASPRAPPATRFASAAATPRRTPPAWPARSTPPRATPTARPLWRSSTRRTGSAASRRRCSPGRPIGAPILLSDGDELPAVTEDVLERLDPKGSDLSEDAQVIRVGEDVGAPDGLQDGGDQGRRRRSRARPRSTASSRPRAGKPVERRGPVLGEQAEWAMPAAAWAARSGDAALPVEEDDDPAADPQGARGARAARTSSSSAPRA